MKNEIEMECERCKGILTYRSNNKGEEIESCNFCGLLRGRLIKDNELINFNKDGVGFYRLKTKNGIIETNTIPKEELDECINKFKILLEDDRVDISESYLSVYDKENKNYKIILGKIDKYSEFTLKKWNEIDKINK